MSAVNNVMIVDDDEIHNYLFTKRIKNVGLSDNVNAFTTCDDGLLNLKEAFNFGNNLPEIIFLDLQMPASDGWEFLDRLEILLPGEVLSNIFLFMLSSSVLPRDIEKAKNHPLIKEYIKKPLMEDELFVMKARYFKNQVG